MFMRLIPAFRHGWLADTFFLIYRSDGVRKAKHYRPSRNTFQDSKQPHAFVKYTSPGEAPWAVERPGAGADHAFGRVELGAHCHRFEPQFAGMVWIFPAQPGEHACDGGRVCAPQRWPNECFAPAGGCPWQRNTSERGQSQNCEPSDWRAGGGRSARPARRRGKVQSVVPTPILLS